MRKVIAFLMTVTVCLSLMIMPAMAAEDYPEVGFDFEAFEAQERIDGTPKVASMYSCDWIQRHRYSYCSLYVYSAVKRRQLGDTGFPPL